MALHADIINCFKSRLDKFWSYQELICCCCCCYVDM